MKTNLKRILALALTVLMVVGVVPMAIFAGDANEESKFTAPTYDELVSKYGAENVVYFDDFNTKSVGSSSSGAFFSPYTTGYKMDNGNIKFNFPSDGNGGAACQFIPSHANNQGFGIIAGAQLGYTPNATVAASNIGKSFVMMADVKMPSATLDHPTYLFFLSDGVSNSKNDFIPILVDKDGDVYLGYYNGGVLDTTAATGGAPNAAGLSSKEKAGGRIAKLKTDEFTNLAVVFDVAANKLSVYVDGVNVTGDLTLFNNTQETRLGNNGFALFRAWLAQTTGNAGKCSACYIFDNIGFCWGDSYVTESDVEAADVDFLGYGAGDYVAKYGAENILFYDNFNSKAANTVTDKNKTLAGLIGTNSMTVQNGHQRYLPDGRGGTATQMVAEGGAFIYFSGENLDYNKAKDNSGKSFVLSLDIKMPATGISHGAYLFSIRDTKIDALFPVVIDKDGTLYLGYNQFGVLDVSTSANQAYVNPSSNLNAAQKAGGKIGKLSADKFTNIGVVMDVENNKFLVYVDGVEKTGGNKVLFNETQLANLKTNADGIYNLSNLQIVNANPSDCECFIFDNVAVTWGNSYFDYPPVSAANTGNEGDKNGLYPENGVLCYYENGVKLTNTTTPDGVYNIDAEGVINYGGYPLNNPYTKIAGNFIPVYNTASGIYMGNQILGADDGGIFIYDDDKNLIKSTELIEIDGVYYTADSEGLADFLTAYIDDTYYVFGTKCEAAEEIFAAIPDGKTYKLSADINIAEEYFEIFNNNITIDLNGYALNFENVSFTGNVAFVDSGAERGSIKAVEMGFAYYNGNSNVVIASCGVDDDGYESFVVLDVVEQHMVSEGEDGAIDFLFRPALENTATSNEFFADAYTSGLDIYVTVTAYDENGVAVVETDPLYAGADLLAIVYYDNTKGIKLSITGYETYARVEVSYSIYTTFNSVDSVYNVEPVVIYENV